MTSQTRAYFAQQIAASLRAERQIDDTADDIAYLKSLRFYQLNGELKGWGLLRLRAIARALNLPTQYDDGKMKPKDVMVAVVYEGIRLAKIDDEPPQRKGCQRCFCCRSGNRYGCSRDADASMIQAVNAMAE